MIQDFGAKLDGARKHFAKGSIAEGDIDGMNEAERAQWVTKEMIWPAPDYSEMSAEGFDRAVLICLKALRDAFPSKPEKAGLVGQLVFVRCLNAARSLEKVDGLSGLRAWLDSATARSLCVTSKSTTFGGKWVTRSVETGEGMKALLESSGFEYRRAFRMTMAVNSVFGKMDEICDQTPDRFSFREKEFSFVRKNEAWPNGKELWEIWARRRQWAACEQADGTWRIGYEYATVVPLLLEGKRVVFPNQAEALAGLKSAVEEILTTAKKVAADARKARDESAKGVVEKFPGALVEKDWAEGRDITGDDYLRTFGFRGGQFGNWVSQRERQEVMNRGYNALMDLADVLDVPPLALAHMGTLGIGFGSRGQGGRKAAAAHFETGENVMNLTKPHGAGCLGHEWAHSFDFALYNWGLALGGSYEMQVSGDQVGPFLSATRYKPKADGDPDAQILVDLAKAIESLCVCSESDDDVRRRINVRLENAQNGIHGWVEHGIRCIAKKSPERAAACRESLIRAAAPLLMATGEERSVLFDSITKLEQAVGDAMQGVKGRADVVSAIRSWFPQLAVCHEAVRIGIERQARQSKPTAYADACKNLDTEDGKKPQAKLYYVRREEIFARAFEAWADDKLRSMGRMSPFLIWGTTGKAYPQGEERTRCSAALNGPISAWAARMRAQTETLQSIAEMRRVAAIEDGVVTENNFLLPADQGTAASTHSKSK